MRLCNYVDVVKLAEMGNDKHLVLFHHDPTNSDDYNDDIVSKAENIVIKKIAK